MSIENQIERINQNISNTYTELEALGADAPDVKNSENLASTVQSVKAILYTEQDLTEDQKEQARNNVGADPKGTAAAAVSAHNTSTDAHTDMRQEIKAIREQLMAFLDVDEETLNELSELIARIVANQTSIAQLTTGKVSVSDIIDNLTTNVANKPMSAAQGVVIKTLIDGLASGKLDASKLTEAINTALAQAKANGEFDGADGQRGLSLLTVTTAPSSYTTAVGGITPKYRMAISTIKSQAGVTEVLLGDVIKYSYYQYRVDYLDASYAYFTTRVSLRGAAGAAATFEITEVTALAYGAAPTVTEQSDSTAQARKYVVGIPTGKPGDPYELTPADKAEIMEMVIESIGGNPVFGYVEEDTKAVVLKNAPGGEYTYYYIMEDGTRVKIGVPVEDTYFTVTNNLTNCTSNNSAVQTIGGQSYSAVITANSGYDLKSVIVIMGGSPITVSGGNISITSVTGNIVITAVAEEKQAAEPVTTDITILKDTSLKGSNFDEDRTETAGYCATSSIDLTNIPKPCIIHLTGACWENEKASDSSYIRFSILDIGGAKLAVGYTHSSFMPSGMTLVHSTENRHDVTVTVTGNNIGKVRFAACYGTAGNNSGTGNFEDAKATLTYTPVEDSGSGDAGSSSNYTNLLPSAIDTDGSAYGNGKGYISGYKLSCSSEGGTPSAASGAYVSGFIPVTGNNDKIRIKNITLHAGTSINNIIFYNKDKTKLHAVAGIEGGFAALVNVEDGGIYRIKPAAWMSNTEAVNLGFFRFSCGGITDETIVTVNEEIVDNPTITQKGNLADPTSADWQEGYRISISGGNTSPLAGHTTTNYIPCKVGDVLRLKGLKITGFDGNGTESSNAAKIVAFNSSKSKVGGLYGSTTGTASTDSYGKMVSTNGDISEYTLMYRNDGSQTTLTNVAYIRIDGFLMNGYTKNDVIITINEEIV